MRMVAFPRCSLEATMITPTARWFAGSGSFVASAIRIMGIIVLVAGLFTPALKAQTVGASLQGIVTDSSGAPVPSANVTVIGVATGGTWDLSTDSAGRYRVPVLQPG